MRRLIFLFIVLLMSVNCWALQKNVASQKWVVFAFDLTDNTPKTGDAGQITAEISIDGAAGDTVDDANPTELEDGYYVFDIAQAETNGDYLVMMPESSTGNIQVIGVPGGVWTTAPYFSVLSIDSNGRLDIIKVAGTTQTANDMSGDVDTILIDTAAYDTDAEYATAIWNALTNAYGGAGTYGQAAEDILADTAAQDTTSEIRTLLTGADTPVCKDSTPLTAAEAEAEAYDAIELANLDHWMKVVTSNSATLPEVVDDTVLANILTKTDGDTSDYDFTLHSFEAIRDRGDAAWITGGGTGLTALETGTAQAGAAGTITLAAAESATNDIFNGCRIGIHTGTGAGQSRLIIDYDGGTKVATVHRNWITNPGNDSQYEILGSDTDVGWIEGTDATDAINTEADNAIVTYELDHLVYVADSDDPADNSIVAKMFASDGDWSGGSAATDALEAIADAIVAYVSGSGVNVTKINNVSTGSWTSQMQTGFEYFVDVGAPGKTINDVGLGGAVINTSFHIPSIIDIAGTATVRFTISVIDSVDDLPTTAEITPGTIKIERKPINGTTWAVIVNDDACSEVAGQIYYDEVLNTASGYREEDSLRITFKSQKVTVGGNDFEITDGTGTLFYSYIRKALPDIIFMPYR